MNARTRIATKKAPAPVSKLNGAKLLQPRTADQVNREPVALADEERLSTPDQSAVAASPPSGPSPRGHSFGEVAVWPRSSVVGQAVADAVVPGLEPVSRHDTGPQSAYRRDRVNPAALRPADLLALQRMAGNGGVQRILSADVQSIRTSSTVQNQQNITDKNTQVLELESGSSPVIQCADEEQSNLATLHKKLDQFDVPEDHVINLLSRLSSAEKETVVNDPWYRKRMVKSLNFNEMSRAMINLKPQLGIALEWLKAASVATRAIDYYEIKPFIVAAPRSEKYILNTPYWRNFFIKICTNENIVEAITDLVLPLEDQLAWLEQEVGSIRISIAYSDIQSLVRDAPQNQRNALKTERWRNFFMKVCDNKTIVAAVRDLNFEPRQQIEWILEEGNTGYLLGGGIDARQIYEALEDVLQGDALEFVELASLNKWKPEDEKRLRQIMDSHRKKSEMSASSTLGLSEDEPNEAAIEFAKKTDTHAAKLIKMYTQIISAKESVTYMLRSKALAGDLATKLTSDPLLVRQVLDILTVGLEPHLKNKDDDVAVMILEAVPEDETLRNIAHNSQGRRVLLAMVRKLFKGINLPDEEKQQKRVMQAVSDVDTDIRKGTTREVEVITFLYGGKGLDWAGENVLGGYRGHTALVVGDLVYSFEAGWSCGYTKDDYMRTNEYRDAIGQVLDVSENDAKILQAELNGSCGKSVYFISGDICTGKASRAIQKALDKKLYEVENPQLFVGYLESTRMVKKRNYYPKTAKGSR